MCDVHNINYVEFMLRFLLYSARCVERESIERSWFINALGWQLILNNDLVPGNVLLGDSVS